MENQAEHGSAPRNVFLLSMVGLGTMLALAISQVPQPWRGLLVGWLLLGLPLGPGAELFLQP